MKPKYQKNLKFFEDYGVVTMDSMDSVILTDAEDKPLKYVWAFILVKAGRVSMTINNNLVELSPNDLLFYSDNRYINNIEQSEDFKGDVLILNGNIATELINSNINMMKNLFFVSDHPVLHLQAEEINQCLRYFDLLHYTYKRSRPNSSYNKEILRSQARAFLYEWASIVDKNIPTENTTKYPKQGERLFKEFIYLLTSDDIKIRSVENYAKRLCVTPKYLSSVCKRVTGKTASAYIHYYVIKDIKHLLRYSDKSIKEIAEELGFSNVSFFGKYIKVHLGMSPSEYRKKVN